MRVSFWKALGMVSLVADELTKAGADGRVTFDEALVLAKNIGTAAGLQFDDAGAQAVVDLTTAVINAASDGVITIREMVDLTEALCTRLGIDFDRQGVCI